MAGKLPGKLGQEIGRKIGRIGQEIGRKIAGKWQEIYHLHTTLFDIQMWQRQIFRKWFFSYFEKYLLVHFLKIFHVISPFLNFQCSTSHFLKKHKISLVLLIGPFLIRTDCVYFWDAVFHQKLKIYDVLSLLHLWLAQTTRPLHEILTQLVITENAWKRLFSNNQPCQYFI